MAENDSEWLAETGDGEAPKTAQGEVIFVKPNVSGDQPQAQIQQN